MDQWISGSVDQWIFGLLDYATHKATQLEPGIHEVGRVAAIDGFV
jgi:hypothetical protein